MHAIGQNDIDPYSIFDEPLQTRDPAADTYSDFPAYQASQQQELERECLQIVAADGVLAACQNSLCYAANPPACDAAVAEQEEQGAEQQRSTMITYAAVGAVALVVGYFVLR